MSLDARTRAALARGHGHRLGPLLMTVGGVAAVVASVRLGLGTMTQPGPGAWPLLASVALVVTGGWLTVTGIEQPEETSRSDLARVAAAMGAAVGFIILLPLVGMPVPAFLLIATVVRLFGESWRTTLLTALFGVVSLQIVFVELLGLPLPVGPLAPGS